MGVAHDALLSFLNTRCAQVSAVKVDPPRYPLASEREVHLVCTGYSGGPLVFDTAAFVVADGALAQMEALGVRPENVYTQLGEADGTYMAMENFRGGTTWYDGATARLLWLAESAVHPNLFAWPNPNLANRDTPPVNHSTLVPDLLDFSSDLETLGPAFNQRCTRTIFHENERIWLPNEPSEQLQIDCFGFPYAGFDRKLEAVFGDGKLQLIWVLTAKPEEDRIRNRLVRDWGKPSLVNDTWEVFGDGKISLRKDKPELLLLSDEMIPLYRDQFETD